MKINMLIAPLALIFLTVTPKAFAKETVNFCYAGHCFVPTLDIFLERLPAETDYELSGLGSFRFLTLSTPVDINGQAFEVRYNEVTKKKSKSHFLAYGYDFTPRSATMCQGRYNDLLQDLNQTYGPLKAGQEPKKNKGYTSKIIKEPNGLIYRQTLNKLGRYTGNSSEAKLKFGVKIRLLMTEMRATISQTTDKPQIPSCKLQVVFIRTVK